MSQDIILDHITTMKKDTEYISTILQDHLPKHDNSVRLQIASPFVQLTQNEINEIIEKTQTIVTRTSEINNELEHESWKQFTQQLTHNSEGLYYFALGLNQDSHPDGAGLFEPLRMFNQSVNEFERIIKVSIAKNKANLSKKKYSESQVDASIKELEKEKRETRLKMYNKIDPNLKKLSSNLLSQHNVVLDKAIDKLLRLSGFDTEIYDPGISGNVDVIAIDSREEIVCIFEDTTGKISKSKVDQIVGRKTEYEEEYKLWENVKVYPVVICTNKDVFSDNLAKRECVLNTVSVLTKKELDELIKNVRKGKMSPTLFTEYIKKKIPKS